MKRLVLATLTAAAAPVAVGIVGSWSPVVALSGPPPCVPLHCAPFPQLVVNARGDAVAAWLDYYGFKLSRPTGQRCRLSPRGGDGRWTTPEALPGSTCGAFALGPDGRLVRVWSDTVNGHSALLAQTRTPAGTWNRGQRILSPGESAFGLAVGAAGRTAVAAWLGDGAHSIVSAVQATNGRFGSAITVARSATANVSSFRLAVNARGDAVLGASFSGRFRTAVVALRPAGGPWHTLQVLARRAVGTYVDAPVVALDAGGDAVAVWSEYSPETGTVLRTAFARAGGRFGPSRLLTDHGGPVRVALDATGNALAVWSTGPRGSGGLDTVLSASRPVGGSWSPPQTISQQPQYAYVSEPALAVSPRGDAIVAWRRIISDPVSGRADVIQASIRAPGGSFGIPQDISDPGDLGGHQVVGISANGDAVAVWEGVRAAVNAATYSR